MADVGSEIPTGLLDPPGGCLVIGQDNDQVVPEWRDPHTQVARRPSTPAYELEIDSPDDLFPAYLADEVNDLWHRDSAAPRQALSAGACGRRQDLILRPDNYCRCAESLENGRAACRSLRGST